MDPGIRFHEYIVVSMWQCVSKKLETPHVTTDVSTRHVSTDHPVTPLGLPGANVSPLSDGRCLGSRQVKPGNLLLARRGLLDPSPTQAWSAGAEVAGEHVVKHRRRLRNIGSGTKTCF